MPLTSKGNKILSSMESTYKDPKKAKQVFYASKNKGTISGVDAQNLTYRTTFYYTDGTQEKVNVTVPETWTNEQVYEKSSDQREARTKSIKQADGPHEMGGRRTLGGDAQNWGVYAASSDFPVHVCDSEEAALNKAKLLNNGVGVSMYYAEKIGETDIAEKLKHERPVYDVKDCNMIDGDAQGLNRDCDLTGDEKPYTFACDSMLRYGRIVNRKGSVLLIQGIAEDSGYWFVKGQDNTSARFAKRGVAEACMKGLAMAEDSRGSNKSRLENLEHEYKEADKQAERTGLRVWKDRTIDLARKIAELRKEMKEEGANDAKLAQDDLFYDWKVTLKGARGQKREFNVTGRSKEDAVEEAKQTAWNWKTGGGAEPEVVSVERKKRVSRDMVPGHQFDRYKSRP